MYTTKKEYNNEYKEIKVNDKVFYKFIKKKENNNDQKIEDTIENDNVKKREVTENSELEANINKEKEQKIMNVDKIETIENSELEANINKEKEQKYDNVYETEAIERFVSLQTKLENNKKNMFNNTKEQTKHACNMTTEPNNTHISTILHKISNIEHENTSINNKRKTVQPKRKRYSDQFKDPAYIKKDMYRKIKMLENFMRNNKDINEEIDKYKNYISKSIEILNSEYQMSVKELFKIFNLKEYDFEIHDFCNESEE